MNWVLTGLTLSCLKIAKGGYPASSWVPDWNVAEVESGLIEGRLLQHVQMTSDLVDPEQMFKSELIPLVFQLPTKFLSTLPSQRVLRECVCVSEVRTHMCLGRGGICWVT